MKVSRDPRVVVIGGGITGLVAARRITRAAPQAEVVVLEADERLGGKLFTQQVAGVPVEAGADWFVTRNPAALDLCRELGIDGELVPPSRSGALVWSGGELHPIPVGLVRGVPMRPLAVARTGALSRLGGLRACLDLAAPRPLAGRDVSVGELVRRRFGAEVLERLVDPLLAASRAGSPDELSLAAAAPELDAVARSNRSIIRGLRRMAAEAPTGEPFLGLRGGMTTLVDALRRDLGGAEIRTASQVTSIEPSGDGYVVRATEDVTADAVICAAPAPPAAQALRALDAELASGIARIRYNPAVVATLVYPPSDSDAPSTGSGILVPAAEKRFLTACAWFSEKWAHARPSDGRLIVRCFVAARAATALGDDEMIERIAADLRDAVGLRSRPTATEITRWEAALPVYEVGHLERVARIEERAARFPGLELAGAAYRGSGIPDCIVQGAGAAARVVSFLGAFGGERVSLEPQRSKKGNQ